MAQTDRLVILPGLICDGAMFAHTLAAFPQSLAVGGFYGGADRIAAMADYALAQMPDRCTLLGHSMGARVALEVYRRAPDRVARLVLADTGVHPVQPAEAPKRYALRDTGRAQGFGALVGAWLPPMLGDAARGDAALVARLTAMCMGAGQAVFEAQTEALLHRPVVDDLLPTIACPTLVVVGEADVWSPVAQHEAIAAAIPGAVMRVVPGAGHMLPAEAPKDFTAILRDWIH